MADTSPPERQPASDNEWYMLATVAGEDHAKNRYIWNGYMRHLIGDAAAANLKRGDGTSIVLPTLRPGEIWWITRNFPGPIQVLSSMISLSGLDFADAVNFQDFYFPVFVDFTGSTFAGIADFTGSTFAGIADFTGSTFAGIANFTGSTFAGIATFTGSRFAGIANFVGSTFVGNAFFAESTFVRYAFFAESTFAGYTSFEKSTFARDASFTGRKFKGEADFRNAKYEGKTSFQNVIFTRAPLFFETTLHEDTDWTGITWPDKPADKEDATQYVRRYDRLALIMSTLKQPDNEHQFFRLSMRAKEVRDGEGISTRLSRLYGQLFRYGWGLERALNLWVLHILLGAGCLSVVPPCTMSYPLSGLTALVISFSNSFPFLGLHRGPAKSAYASFDTLTGFNIIGGIQSVIGPLLLFFLLLTIRNRFRLR